jgi:hypothetical protein
VSVVVWCCGGDERVCWIYIYYIIRVRYFPVNVAPDSNQPFHSVRTPFPHRDVDRCPSILGDRVSRVSRVCVGGGERVWW